MKCSKVILTAFFSAMLVCGCAGKSDSEDEDMYLFENALAEPGEDLEETEDAEEAEEDSSVRVVSQRDLIGEGGNSGLSSDYISEDEIASLYAKRKSVSNAKNFEGDWQRIEIENSAGDIEITDQTDEGFSFEGFFIYTVNTGDCSGTAYFVSQDTAISCIDEVSEAYIAFHKVGSSMYVSHTGEIPGMGMDVTPDGEYISN